MPGTMTHRGVRCRGCRLAECWLVLSVKREEGAAVWFLCLGRSAGCPRRVGRAGSPLQQPRVTRELHSTARANRPGTLPVGNTRPAVRAAAVVEEKGWIEDSRGHHTDKADR